MLRVSNLKAGIDGKEILKGVNLVVGSGQIHVLMGPNGSGKSTLAQVIAGHPGYKVDGQLSMDNRRIMKLTPDKRAKLGIFLGFQHPVEVPGVSVFNFLRKAQNADRVKKKTDLESAAIFREELKKYMGELKLPEDFLRRSLNEGFSGGEKKRNEILQMMALRPKLAILDEIDSGLDVDGLRLVALAIKSFRAKNPKSSTILITHYARILKYLRADFVHIMIDGKIAKSGTAKLAETIEKKGYEVWQTV
ncbi:MAG: Fe-S cluster assembly ATPase SufC [Candidatus Curtissbacteria bacterium]